MITQVPPPPARDGPVLQSNGTFAWVWSGWFRKLQQAVNGGLFYSVSVVANLPNGKLGDWAIVTDANGPTYNSIVAGGGAVTIPVFFDGTNWRCH